MHTEKELLRKKIEDCRRKLIKVATAQGFNSSETIRLSQNLDKLILKYQKS
ncbi:aspartyl-phosphate phosphatase Spo0E family protein [Mesobacillus subterraneus]|uniref:Aspartyl-phosphate phosphatase Spo0E family protein n=1 Tax=Mesobacillus subterraneus TaxID=285983 RepID=A0A3R9F2S7_9BACI|nr:aspartyl-phosphate phosphatase Spo0E family protein [Mesobacillus subterraneus]RSD28661.1 aspartyl-phosphate phosphatase Spo0E family protein [Mesobacillus subterraneus]